MPFTQEIVTAYVTEKGIGLLMKVSFTIAKMAIIAEGIIVCATSIVLRCNHARINRPL